MEENWKSIEETNGRYEVSNFGNVRSKDRYEMNRYKLTLRKGIILKQSKDGCGYPQVQIYSNKKRMTRHVHRLVAKAFLDEASGMQVNHIDGNKNNNKSSNLEWISHSDNMKHAIENGLLNTTKRKIAYCSFRKFTDDQITEIRTLSLSGKSQGQISKMFNVSQPTISFILRNKTYQITTSSVV